MIDNVFPPVIVTIFTESGVVVGLMLKNLNLHFVVEVSSVVVLRNKSCNSFYRHTLIF